MDLKYSDLIRKILAKPLSSLLIFLSFALSGYLLRSNLSSASEYMLEFTSTTIPVAKFSVVEKRVNLILEPILAKGQDLVVCSVREGGCYLRWRHKGLIDLSLFSKVKDELKKYMATLTWDLESFDSSKFQKIDKDLLKQASLRSKVGIEIFFERELFKRFLSNRTELSNGERAFVDLRNFEYTSEYLYQEFLEKGETDKLSELGYLQIERSWIMAQETSPPGTKVGEVSFDLLDRPIDPDVNQRSVLFGLVLGLFGLSLSALVGLVWKR